MHNIMACCTTACMTKAGIDRAARLLIMKMAMHLHQLGLDIRSCAAALGMLPAQSRQVVMEMLNAYPVGLP